MNPRGFFLTIVGQGMVVAALCALASPAKAAPLPRLVVVRPAEAGDCPDAPILAAAVERQMHHPALDPMSSDPSAPLYEVTLAHGDDGYAAVIRSGESTRELSDPGSTCTELADALALTLAILLDSDPSPPPPPPPPPPPSPPVEPKVIPAKPILDVPQSRPGVQVRILPQRTWHFGVDIGTGKTLGVLTPWSNAVDGGIFVRRERFTIGAGVFAIPSVAIQDFANRGVANVYLVAGRLDLCGRIAGNANNVQFAICGQTLVGAVHAAGSGYPENRQGSQPWVGLGPMALLQGSASTFAGWSFKLSVTAPVVHQRFISNRIDGIGADARETIFTIFESSSVAAFMVAGIHFTIL